MLGIYFKLNFISNPGLPIFPNINGNFEDFQKKRIFLITRSGKGEIPKEIKSNLMYFLARGFAKEISNDHNKC